MSSSLSQETAFRAFIEAHMNQGQVFAQSVLNPKHRVIVNVYNTYFINAIAQSKSRAHLTECQ